MKTLRGRLLGVLTASAVIVIAWTIVAIWVAPEVTPAMPEVAATMWDDRAFYVPHIQTTLVEAAWGYLWGNMLALIIGSVIVLARPTTSALFERISVAFYAVPLLAVGPILQIVTRGSVTKVTLAAMAVFFTTTVMWALGLRSADRAALDVVRATGGGKLAEFTKIRVRAALPYLFAGLQIAAPAAVLGAIVGEYLGGSRGLGVALIQAQSSFQVGRTWGLAVVIALLVGGIYAVTGLIGRSLTPWAGRESPVAVLQLGGKRLPPGRRVLVAAASGVVLLALWWGLLAAFSLDRYFANRPLDTLSFLLDPANAESRSLLIDATVQTLIDTAVGFSIGLVASVGVAAAVVLSKTVNRVVTPVSIALRSVPIIAMTPLIALVFGRGLGAVTVIVGLVTFFPTLVAVATSLRNAPVAATDIVRAYGGSDIRSLRSVRMPFAIPTLFSAARIALPSAIGGALLAEWLATGSGLGSLMLRSSASSRFGVVWAGAALVVVISLAGYALVGYAEKHVAARIGATAEN